AALDQRKESGGGRAVSAGESAELRALDIEEHEVRAVESGPLCLSEPLRNGRTLAPHQSGGSGCREQLARVTHRPAAHRAVAAIGARVAAVACELDVGIRTLALADGIPPCDELRGSRRDHARGKSNWGAEELTNLIRQDGRCGEVVGDVGARLGRSVDAKARGNRALGVKQLPAADGRAKRHHSLKPRNRRERVVADAVTHRAVYA